jgi:hypothetical protein
MDGIKLLKEPECWCGPNSVAVEPQPFKQIPEDHFQLTPKECKEIQQILDSKGQPDEFGVPPPSTFTLKGVPTEFKPKQLHFSSALDQHISMMKKNPQESRPVLEELWKLNNVVFFDLGYGLRSV